jgi:tripartite-type tricarboxylate transporter receptor subunit TctC
VDYAKANPGKFTFGSTGNGTTPHLAVEEFAMKAGIQLQHVPFKGSADGMASVLGGHVMAHSDATGWAPHVDAGTCRLLATYGSKRTKRWSNVPTLNELGYDTVSDSPFGIGGPKGMDPAVVRKLQDAFKKTLEDPQVLATFEKFDQASSFLLEELQANDGYLPLNDHSGPDDIREQLGMSKKLFKQAVGKLYKQQKITIEEKGIRIKNG